MQFVYPAFMFALLALAIPIIIHLFHFRRFKRVYFTNVRFLREVKEETSSRSRLRNLLVLLMRLLALAFLVFAFAQPFIPQRDEVVSGAVEVSIFVDNSFSMSALSRDVGLLEQAKRRAREIVEAYQVEDRFQILTHDLEGRHQRLVNREEALALIDEIEITPVVHTLSEVVQRQREVLLSGEGESKELYLISDFQRSITDLEQFEQDSAIAVSLLPLQSVQERNISVDSAWFEAPVQARGRTGRLMVKVRNRSEEAVEDVRLSLLYDGQNKPVGTLNIPAQTFIVDTVNLTPQTTGWQRALLSVTDYPIQFDDEYRISFYVPDQISILSIYQQTPNAYLGTALGELDAFQLETESVSALNYTRFGDYQLIVLNDLEVLSGGLTASLQQYVEQGGSLLIFPPRDAQADSYRPLLAALNADELLHFQTGAMQVSRVNTEAFVFNDVFERTDDNMRLPSTSGSFRLTSLSNRPGEQLLTYRDGSPYLLRYPEGMGNLYLCAAPLDLEFNDLVRNGEIFVPMLYKMALSSGREGKIAYTIGLDAQIQVKHQISDQNPLYKMRGERGEFIPRQRVVGTQARLQMIDQPRAAGYYEVFQDPSVVLRVLAFNYDRRESALNYFHPDELKSLAGESAEVLEVLDSAMLTERIQAQSRGIRLWKWCLVLALLALAAETALLRLWKV